MSELDAKIRQILEAHGHLATSQPQLKDDDDLYERGLSSHASVNVMLALEDTFDVEFPDSLLKRGTFRSIAAIREALESLTTPAASQAESG
jgi:acyl carrier protein